MTTYEIVRNAILNKQQVFATYDGHPREFCPHAIGTKGNREQALFYQFGGSGSKAAVTPNSSGNWRCIPIEGLSSVTVQAGAWHSAANHSKAQTCVDNIDVEVSF